MRNNIHNYPKKINSEIILFAVGTKEIGDRRIVDLKAVRMMPPGFAIDDRDLSAGGSTT